MNPPLVSVIIPTYNRCALAIEAVASALNQTYPHVEVIVVDDGSIDDTAQRLPEQFGERIQFYCQENSGSTAARNNAASRAKGKYIAFLDSDDLFLPEKIARQVEYLENHPDCSTVFCQALPIENDGRPANAPVIGSDLAQPDLTLNHMLTSSGAPGGNSTGMMSLALYRQLGGYDDRLLFGDDFDLFVRAMQHGRLHVLPEPLACIRLHAQTLSFSRSSQSVTRAMRDRLLINDRLLELLPQPENRPAILRLRCRNLVDSCFSYLDLNEPQPAAECIAALRQVLPALGSLEPQWWTARYRYMAWQFFRAGRDAASLNLILRKFEKLSATPPLQAYNRRKQAVIYLVAWQFQEHPSTAARLRMLRLVFSAPWLIFNSLVNHQIKATLLQSPSRDSSEPNLS